MEKKDSFGDHNIAASDVREKTPAYPRRKYEPRPFEERFIRLRQTSSRYCHQHITPVQASPKADRPFTPVRMRFLYTRDKQLDLAPE